MAYSKGQQHIPCSNAYTSPMQQKITDLAIKQQAMVSIMQRLHSTAEVDDTIMCNYGLEQFASLALLRADNY